MDFAPAARFAHRLAEAALGQDLPPNLLLNVNVPGGIEPTAYAVTRLGKHSYGFEVVEKVDPRGRKYYWIGGNEYQHEDIPGSDCNAVLRDGIVSVTPAAPRAHRQRDAAAGGEVAGAGLHAGAGRSAPADRGQDRHLGAVPQRRVQPAGVAHAVAARRRR